MPTEPTRTVDSLVVPVRRVEPIGGTFRWPKNPVLVSPREADQLPLEQLAGTLRSELKLKAKLNRNPIATAAVRIIRDKSIERAEAYRLLIKPAGIEILASGDAGAYYAVQTLRDLVSVSGKTLKCCRIDDAPDYRRRGVYHDCSRGKVPTLATLKDLVERLAHWKVNEFQLYIENVFSFARHPDIGRGYSAFTASDILELQKHCKLHHVRLVGSLASFGHMERILALPKYIHLGEKKGFFDCPGGTTLCPIDRRSIKLVSELYEEFVPLFEAEDFNICGDETFDLGKGRSRRAAEKAGIGRLYLDFLLEIRKLCHRHGKRMNAWADIILKHPELLNDVPRDIVMLNWDYGPDGKRMEESARIAGLGLPVMACPGTGGWLSNGCKLKKGMANIAKFARVGLEAGAEGLLNTDWGDGGHRNTLSVSLHNLAYGAAKSWNAGGTVDDGFTSRFCRNMFGAVGKSLEKPLLALGGAARENGDAGFTPIYGSLTGPMFVTNVGPVTRYLDPEHWMPKWLKTVDIGEFGPRRDEVSQLTWPSPRQARNDFEAHAMEEFRLACILDRAGCSSAEIIARASQNKPVPPALPRRFAEEGREAIAELKRVWPLRNRPSRLVENLTGIWQAIKEYPGLA